MPHPLVTVCIDDTDMPDTRGTNKLALSMLLELRDKYRCHSLTKHPHLRHPDIPYTHGNNSCCIRLQRDPELEVDALIDDVRRLMNEDFIEGSDPGLCVTTQPLPPAVQRFALRSRREVLTMEEARALAGEHRIHLEGLGGTNQGIIGALAGAGTAAAGGPGAFLQLGDVPLDFGGLVSPGELARLGIRHLIDHQSDLEVEPRPLWVPKKLRPSMRGGQPVVFVKPTQTGELSFVRRDD